MRPFVTTLAVLATLCLGAARAQFDAYVWTLVDPNGDGNYVLGDEMHIECAPMGFGTCDTRYEAVAPADGTFLVDVSATTVAPVGLGAYTYRNGVKQPICKTCTTQATLGVAAGDTFGFGMAADDLLQADVTLTNLVFVLQPTVASIGRTLSFLEEPVTITGTNFGPDTTVRVDGVPEPVVSFTATTLVIEPGPRAPGFYDVEVVNGGFAVTEVEDGLACLPTVALDAGALGGPMTIAVDGGVPGAYLLLYGLEILATPQPIGGAWYGLLLDPGALFGVLVTGALPGTGPVGLQFTVPDVPAYAGVLFHLQAWAQQGGAPGGVTASFSNRATGVIGGHPAVAILDLAKATPVANDHYGETLARLGDLDGDGLAEIGVGAPDSDEAAPGGGSVRVHSGADGSLLFTIQGTAAGGRLGSSLDGNADIDADGVDDLVVGSGGAGLVTVRSGVDGAVLRTFGVPHTAVAGLGDLNVDGVPEVGVGNGSFDSSYVVVYDGATGAVLREHTAPVSDSLGASMALIGDVNKDGTLDYVVGAPRNGCGSGTLAYARVYSGRNGGELYTFHADACSDLGSAVADAGDVDLDGWPDVLVGAPAATGVTAFPQPGFVRVYSGKDGTILHEFTGEMPIAYPPLNPVAERFGASVDGAGDVNGDGVPDVIVGVPHRGGHPAVSEGAVLVYSGAFGTLLHERTGATAPAWLGASVAGLGDLDGDGRADFGAGAPRDLVGGVAGGRVLVWTGVP